MPHLSNDVHTPHVALRQILQGTTLSLGKEGVSHSHDDLELCDLGEVPEPLWSQVLHLSMGAFILLVSELL